MCWEAVPENNDPNRKVVLRLGIGLAGLYMRCSVCNVAKLHTPAICGPGRAYTAQFLAKLRLW